MAIGDNDETGSATLSYDTNCAKTYYYSNGGCTFCTKGHSGGNSQITTITIAPTDDPASVGTYALELIACYDTDPHFCSTTLYISVTVTSPCANIAGASVNSNPSAIYVF